MSFPSASRRRAGVLPSVAVVVPIYNVEDFLLECLESVAAQTVFPELEVVLVDDGSTDSSGEIAEAFSARYPNVRLVRQENRGLGGARNRGLEEVTAPFVTFLDSDDRLPAAAVETLRAVMVEHGADVAVGKMETFPKPTAYAWLKHLDAPSKVIPGIEHAAELVHGASVCNKLFRTDALRSMGLRFGERIHFEDVFVSLPVLLTAERIAVTSSVVYEYRQRAAGGSIMDALWTRPENYWDHLTVEEFVSGLRSGVTGPRKRVIDLFLVRSFQGFALRAPEVFSGAVLRAFFDRAVEVYRGIAPEVIHHGCHDARHRIPIVALAMQDWALFSDRDAAIRSVEAHEGRLRIALGRELPDLVQALLVADRMTAHVESVEAEDDVVRVTGRFAVDGLPMTTPVPCRLGVRVRGSAITQPARNMLRQTVVAGVVKETWSGFTCEIPAGRLRSGEHHLRLVFETATGQASVFTRPTSGALNAARTLEMSTGFALLRKQGHAAVLQVTVGTDRSARRAWRKRHLVEDVKHVAMRRPLWRQRLCRLVTKGFFRSPVWLLGERRDTAQDNSSVLFEHLRRNRPDIRAYYVIDKNSTHYGRIRSLGRVIPHSGLRHRLLMLHADVLINSYDINSYMLPSGWNKAQYLQELAWRVGSRRVFLQHGVTWHNVSAALHKSVTGVDLFVVTSEQEADAARRTMAYDREVALTGFPRFDRLARGPVGRRILVMPTWRSFLVNPSYRGEAAVSPELARSDFARFWTGLLAHRGLVDVLERGDATLEFFGHYELAEALRSLAPAHPRVVVSHHGTRSVQEAILDCSLLVTDWSSTFFDAAYAGRPVVLAPFDEEAYRTKQYAVGYLDVDDVGFGPVARTVPEVVEAISHYVRNDFRRESHVEDRVRSFFAHHDVHHCERVTESISRMLRGLPQAADARTPAVERLELAA